MSDDTARLFAELLHHRMAGLAAGDAISPAIQPASTFLTPSGGSNAPFQYGRFHNPTWDQAEAALGLLEGAEVITFPSGMAAVAAVLMTQARAGARILLPSDGYYASRLIAEKFFGPFGVTTDLRPTASFAEGGFDGYALVIMETPSNPGLDVCDIALIAAAAKKAGAIVVVDNTTMTPLGQRPLDLGADISISSDTKAINGHSDVLFGHLATRDPAIAAALHDYRKYTGPIPSPFDAWLVHRGLETLELRYARMTENAAALAARFIDHPKVTGVRYPGLPSDPAHAIARKQTTSFGFMLGVTLADATAADRFIDECTYVQSSTSFGGLRTSGERRAKWGDPVPPGYVRLSAGCEPLEPLWTAMAETLKIL
ncbi:Cystathionine gamma-lyase [Alphaproteobacteria bacterium SO-S41]|nr:Cystathionine gamma-lyase [Alphaproteobacteria bacterium SO-S41]